MVKFNETAIIKVLFNTRCQFFLFNLIAQFSVIVWRIKIRDRKKSLETSLKESQNTIKDLNTKKDKTLSEKKSLKNKEETLANNIISYKKQNEQQNYHTINFRQEQQNSQTQKTSFFSVDGTAASKDR